jgi:hypothetical protein
VRPARSRGWVLVALIVAPALAGCSARRGPGPIAGGVGPEQLLGTLAARRESVTSLRARARLKAGLAGMWTRQAVLVQRPGEVRMDVLSPFGLALAVGTQRDLLWAYSPSDQVRFEGEASPKNLARFLGAPVTVTDLVDILMGLPPARSATGPPAFARDPDQHIVITIPFEGGTQQLWFDPVTLQLERGEERHGDTLVFTVAFGDYRDGFPYALDVASPVVGSAARLAYDSVERNPALDPTVFAPPSSPRVLPLEAAATSG